MSAVALAIAIHSIATSLLQTSVNPQLFNWDIKMNEYRKLCCWDRELHHCAFSFILS